MGKKIYFQDGSAIEISTEILEPGEMATAAYKKILEFIEDELVEPEILDDDDLDDLVEPDLDDLDDFEDDDLELELDDDDDDELELDDDEWAEEDEDDDRW